MPAELEKGADGEWKVTGLASTGTIDRQGEIISPEGIDASPIAQGKGVFNFDHDNSPESTIGLLDGYKKTDKGMFVTGRLFKNHTKAKAVYEIMSSLGKADKGRVGMSVEGKVLERDPFNPKIIKRCVVKNVAITLNPVNTDTYADIMKSFAGSNVEFDSNGTKEVSTDLTSGVQLELPTFTASQVVAIVEKALGIGAGNSAAPAGRSGGDALGISNMGEKPKKKKVKQMSKALFKSNMDELMSKLQVLYPESSREEIWSAVKERMNTQYEAPDFEKGGQGSGVKGHKTNHGNTNSENHKGFKVEVIQNPQGSKFKFKLTGPDGWTDESGYNYSQAMAEKYGKEKVDGYIVYSKDKLKKGGPGSGQKGHETHHYEPAKIPGYKFTHSAHNDKAQVPNVTHHYESEGKVSHDPFDDKHHEKLSQHAEKHHGRSMKTPDGKHTNKIMGTSVSENRENKKHQFEVTLKK